jgi:hypothetical protein
MKSSYRVVKPLTDEERDRVLKEFVRLQEIQETKNDTLSQGVSSDT